MHGAKQSTTKYASNSKHVERMHENVVFCLEDEHEVERARDSEWHAIRERSLSKGINEEHCRSSNNGCAVSNADPGPHSQSIAEFPLPTHVAEDANEEVEHDKLVRAAVIKPFVQRSGFPHWVQM